MAHMFLSPGYTLVIDGKPLEEAKLRHLEVMSPDGNTLKIGYLTLAAAHRRRRVALVCLRHR